MTKFNAAFRKWFGDSKVVDENGQPLVAYHGTPHNFVSFSSKEGDHLGFHFGNLEQAERAGRAKKVGGFNVIKAYLSIRNPLRTIDAGDWSNSYRVWEVLNKATKGAMGEYDYKLNQIPKVERFVILTKALRKLGFDGIVYKNRIEGKGDSWISLDPTQIKSATANDGTWDADDPDIRSNPPSTKELRAGIRRALMAGDRRAAAILSVELERTRK